MPHLMTRVRALLLALALACPLAAHADWKGNEASQALTQEANELYSRGKVNEAVAKYQAAMAADPATSYPGSLLANLLYEASRNAKGEDRARLSSQAEGYSRDALKLEPANPLAQEVLRKVLDDVVVPLNHTPARDAELAFAEGENYFHRNDFDGALKQYELALQRDPQYALAWVVAGDVYYAKKKWPEAEARFRKASELEPMLSQAWRFLSDALLMQGKTVDAEAALFSGIAAQPSQRPNWDKLALLKGRSGMPLKPLHVEQRASAIVDRETKQIHVTIRAANEAEKNDPDNPIWAHLASANAMAKLPGNSGKPALSAYQADLKSWHDTMVLAAEFKTKYGSGPRDPALRTMLELDEANQLEPALFLLMYRESYRAEFEAWKLANPNGIRAFVTSTGLRP